MVVNMTYGTIAYKLFKANFKKYTLFIVCNTFTIAMLFSLVSLIFNEQFMNPLIIDPMISSNTYAPTGILAVFALLFLPYTQNAFIKSRQREYGVLLVLGMTERDVQKNVLLEQSVLCLLFLVCGLLFGTILSYVFFLAVRNIIGFPALEYGVSLRPYCMIIAFVLCVFIRNGFNTPRSCRDSFKKSLEKCE